MIDKNPNWFLYLLEITEVTATFCGSPSCRICRKHSYYIAALHTGG